MASHKELTDEELADMAPFYDSIQPYWDNWMEENQGGNKFTPQSKYLELKEKERKRRDTMRIRIKFRAFSFEGQQEWGDPLKDKVFMQIAITLPLLMAGIDLEVFI